MNFYSLHRTKSKGTLSYGPQLHDRIMTLFVCGLPVMVGNFTYKGAVFSEIRALSAILIQTVVAFTVNLFEPLQSCFPVLARFEVNGCGDFNFLFVFGNCQKQETT